MYLIHAAFFYMSNYILHNFPSIFAEVKTVETKTKTTKIFRTLSVLNFKGFEWYRIKEQSNQKKLKYKELP